MEDFSGSAQRTVQQFSHLPLPYPSRSSPSFALSTWCQSVGLPPPYYHHTPSAQGVIAIVELANGFKFAGSECGDQFEAMESAASVALFQLPRIMPNIPSPHHVAMQQQFSTVLFSSPPNPVSLQTFAGLAALSSQQTVTQSQHCTRSPRSKGTPKTVAPQSTQQRTSPTLNSSAVPFIPLQVSLKRSSRPQSFLEKSQETAISETFESFKLNETQQMEKTQTFSDSLSSALFSDLSTNNVSSQSRPPETSSSPVHKTEKAGIPLKRTTSSSKRLLAPSFFSKKT